MSSTDIFAEPMLDSDEYLKKYKEQLTKLRKERLLPELDATLTYKVYSIRGSQFGAHKSIVLTTDDKLFFTVELGFLDVDGTNHIYPVTMPLDSSNKPQMEYLGTIDAKGQDLIGKAVFVMKHFGSYFKLCNNCQDFCNMYLKEIGLEEGTRLTDGDASAITVAVVGGIITFLFAMSK